MTESKPRIGVIGIAGGWSSELLADKVAERVGQRVLLDMQHARFDSVAGAVTCNDVNLCDLDAVILKKLGPVYSPAMLDRLELLSFVKHSGVRVFSDPEKMLRLIDRLSCTIALQSAGIPLPPTVITEDVDMAVDAVRQFGQAVLKPLYSTKARGMRVLEARAGDLAARIRAFQTEGNPVLYVQKLVDIPGRDLGVAFLGGKYLGGYARVRTNDSWNTTTRDGGKYADASPSDELIALAHRAQDPFNLDFTVVDVVETDTGPVVFEVSAFGGFRGLQEGAGIDAASRYADYVLGVLGHG